MTPAIPHAPATRRQLLTWSGGIGAAVLLAACTAPESTTGSSTAPTTTRSPMDLTAVAFDYPFTFLPVYAGVSKFAQARADELGINFTQTNDQGKPDIQVSSLETLIGQKVPAIVSFPMVFESMEPTARKALDAGLIWVTYGGSMTNQSASIQFSFAEGGKLLGEDAAEWAKTTLGGKGKVFFIVDNTIQLGRERTKGMIDAFTAGAPDMEVVGQEQAIDPDTALTKTAAILAQHPDVAMVLAVTDGAGYGAYKALEQSGRSITDEKTYVGGQDGDLGSLQLIEQGTIYRASAALQLKDIGAAVIDVPKAVADGKSDAEASAEVPIALVKKGDPLLTEIIGQYA